MACKHAPSLVYTFRTLTVVHQTIETGDDERLLSLCDTAATRILRPTERGDCIQPFQPGQSEAIIALNEAARRPLPDMLGSYTKKRRRSMGEKGGKKDKNKANKQKKDKLEKKKEQQKSKQPAKKTA
jgi:hypothetical protein